MVKNLLAALLFLSILMPGANPVRAQAQANVDFECGKWTFVEGGSKGLAEWQFQPWPFDETQLAWVMRASPPGWGMKFDGTFTRLKSIELDLSQRLAPIITQLGEYKTVQDCNPYISFSTSSSTVAEDFCPWLRWDVEADGLKNISLEDQLVLPVDVRRICPSSNHTYTLTVTVSYWKFTPAAASGEGPLWVGTPVEARFTKTVPISVNRYTLDPSMISASDLPVHSIPAVWIYPATPIQFDSTFLNFNLFTVGTNLHYEYWSDLAYSGRVVLKDAHGKQVGVYPIVQGENAYFTRTAYANGVNFVIKLTFNEAIRAGSMEVILDINGPNPQEVTKTEPLQVSPQSKGESGCVSVVAEKILAALHVQTDLVNPLAARLFNAELAECTDVDCAAGSLVEYINSTARTVVHKDPGVLLAATMAALNDSSSLKVCGSGDVWVHSILDAASRSGIPINRRMANSQFLLMVVNPAGQKAGFADANKAVTEINPSVAFKIGGNQYVYYPAQPATAWLTGAAQGPAAFDAVDVLEERVREMIFMISVIPEYGTYASMGPSDSFGAPPNLTLKDGMSTFSLQPDYLISQPFSKPAVPPVPLTLAKAVLAPTEAASNYATGNLFDRSIDATDELVSGHNCLLDCVKRVWPRAGGGSQYAVIMLMKASSSQRANDLVEITRRSFLGTWGYVEVLSEQNYSGLLPENAWSAFYPSQREFLLMYSYGPVFAIMVSRPPYGFDDFAGEFDLISLLGQLQFEKLYASGYTP